MKYLCLVYGEEKVLDALSKGDMEVLVDKSLAYDDVLRKSGHYLVSEALQDVETAKTVRFGTARPSSPTVRSPRRRTAARVHPDRSSDLDDAVRVAARIPLASMGSIEVRPVLELAPL